MKRRAPMRRGGPLRRRTRLAPISRHRRGERAEYRIAEERFLAAHPFCQIWISFHRFNEAQIIKDGGIAFTSTRRTDWGLDCRGLAAPRATQVHHRNKCRGARLNDERFWMAASGEWHQYFEQHLTEARAAGIVLPLNADADGRLPDGTVCRTTDELLAAGCKKDY